MKLKRGTVPSRPVRWTAWDATWLLLAAGALGVSLRGFVHDKALSAQTARVQSGMAAAAQWRRAVEQHAERDVPPGCGALPPHHRLVDGTVMGCHQGTVQVHVPSAGQMTEVRLALTPVWREGGLTWTCDALVPLSATVPFPCHR